jgi:DNA primase
VADQQSMMRIPQHVIDDLVIQTDIVDTIGRALKLKRQGKDFVALCPFHKEQSPSFSVNPAKQFYYCFGCGAGGNTMNFLQNFEGRSFLSVLQDMADIAHVDLSQFMKSNQLDSIALQILPAVNEARKFFEQALSESRGNSKIARDYLIGRNIPEAMWAVFSIGYAPSYGQGIVEALLEHQEALIQAGILARSENTEDGELGRVFSLFRDRVVMPIRDTRGKTVGISGRALKEDEKPKYRNSKETDHFSKNNVLYGLYESIQVFETEKLKHIIAVEGQFDVMANIIQAKRPACAAMGSSMSAQQLRLLLRHAEHITFVFDGDLAGRKAMLQVCTLLLEHLTDLEVTFDVVMMPEGEDPHSMINGDLEGYEALINKPIPWMDAMLSHHPLAIDLESDKGRSEMSVAAVELAHETRDPLLRYQLLEKAAAVVRMPVEALNERLVSFPVMRSAARTIKPEKIMNDGIVRLIRMVWDNPEWSEAIEHPQLWADEGDELTVLLGVWAIQIREGKFDLPLTEADIAEIAGNARLEKSIVAQKRYKGAGVALARMLGELPSHIMQMLMQEEPEEKKSLAGALACHITSLCAGKAMQDLSQKASGGGMTQEDREVFMKLHGIRKVAMQKTRTIDT